MNQFNNLPPEIIEFIFKEVSLNDLINLRIVNKRFKQICEQIKIKQLNVAGYFNYIYSKKFWFYTNDPTYFNEENAIKISKFLNYRSIFKLDKYLRRLSMCLGEYENFNISILNEFKSLEQLEIIGVNLNFSLKFNDDYKLNLENLKIAAFYLKRNSYFKLILNTNKLFAFKLSAISVQLDQFVFNYPDRILFYEADYTFNYDEINKFINLEYLKLNYLYDSNGSINRDILFRFKNLKTLDLSISKYIEESEYDNLKEIIVSILNEKKNLKRSELQIYLYGVKLINQNQLNQIERSSNKKQFKYNQLKFQLKNYDLLKDNCCYMDEIEYCDLIRLIKIIPPLFTNKFPRIYQVYANDHIDNEDQFIEFLNNLKYLTKLELVDCGLTRSFYHKLIDLIYLNDLLYLKIEDNEELGLNFDFIFNLKQLRNFKTNQTINKYVDLIGKLFKEKQNIREFIFKFFATKNYIKINRKLNTNVFEIRSYYLDHNLKKIDNFSIKNLNLDQVISKLANLKLKL